MDKENNTFNYTYSAKEQSEVEFIRKKYLPQTENKLERLRKLDESVSSKATTWSIALGTVGALIMGSGMSLIMSDLGTTLGLDHLAALIIGCIVGVIGLVLAGLAYPAHNYVLQKERKKVAPEILWLTEELMK